MVPALLEASLLFGKDEDGNGDGDGDGDGVGVNIARRGGSKTQWD